MTTPNGRPSRRRRLANLAALTVLAWVPIAGPLLIWSHA